jgi:hypothetical protein
VVEFFIFLIGEGVNMDFYTFIRQLSAEEKINLLIESALLNNLDPRTFFQNLSPMSPDIVVNFNIDDIILYKNNYYLVRKINTNNTISVCYIEMTHSFSENYNKINELIKNCYVDIKSEGSQISAKDLEQNTWKVITDIFVGEYHPKKSNGNLAKHKAIVYFSDEKEVKNFSMVRSKKVSFKVNKRNFYM